MSDLLPGRPSSGRVWTRGRAWLAVAAALAVGGGAAWLLLARDRPAPRPRPEEALAGALTRGLEAALAASASATAPYRCAQLGGPDRPVEQTMAVGERTVAIRGDTARVTPARPALVMGVVADARGVSGAPAGEPLSPVSPGAAASPADSRAVAGLRALADELRTARAELVVSLGGMGETEAEIAAALAALADPSWLTVALPGDREDIGAHRRAVAALAAAGVPVVDGAAIRFVEMDGAVVGTLPGAPARARLAAGDDGCVYAPGDATALADALAIRAGARVWASHAPPRQRGPGAADETADGVHIGDPALTSAIERSGAVLAVHGASDWAALGASSGRGAGPVVLGAGAADPIPIAAALPVDARGGERTRIAAGAALVVTVSAAQIRWRRVVLAPRLAPR